MRENKWGDENILSQKGCFSRGIPVANLFGGIDLAFPAS